MIFHEDIVLLAFLAAQFELRRHETAFLSPQVSVAVLSLLQPERILLLRQVSIERFGSVVPMSLTRRVNLADLEALVVLLTLVRRHINKTVIL
jgi:hypothetical protein